MQRYSPLLPRQDDNSGRRKPAPHSEQVISLSDPCRNNCPACFECRRRSRGVQDLHKGRGLHHRVPEGNGGGAESYQAGHSGLEGESEGLRGTDAVGIRAGRHQPSRCLAAARRNSNCSSVPELPVRWAAVVWLLCQPAPTASLPETARISHGVAAAAVMRRGPPPKRTLRPKQIRPNTYL